MPRPFVLIATADTPEGPLTLHQRGEKEFMILVDGRVLMTTQLSTSELRLAQEGCRHIASRDGARVLIGGLGLGFTLRAALDNLPLGAQVVVCELSSEVVDWCRGPVAISTAGAALDPRVRFIVGDVTHEIERTATNPTAARYDAILWDLYVGPRRSGEEAHPLYGRESLQRTFEALSLGGIFGVWAETESPAFEARLRSVGFSVKLERTRGKGLRHAVYLATKRSTSNQPASRKPR